MLINELYGRRIDTDLTGTVITGAFFGSSGGGGGIRTRGALTDTPVFETGPFNRSGTPPNAGPQKSLLGV